MNHSKPEAIDRGSASPGMTVVELLIIVAALAVVVVLAVPRSSMLIEQYRLKSASTDLVNGLNRARGEAIKRGSTVRICPSSDGRFCRSDGDWTQGWLVYSDGNGDGKAQDIELIQSFEAPNAAVRVIARGVAEQDASFTAAGLLPVDGSASAEFVLCHAGSDRYSRTILIDSEGWVSVAAKPAQACHSG